MTRGAHTPGRWEVGNTDLAIIEPAIFGANRIVARAAALPGKAAEVRAEQIANAHLIASAPDLLEALEEADHILRRAEFFCHPALVELRAQLTSAIAKARGEQP
jgi:hypothetical protein